MVGAGGATTDHVATREEFAVSRASPIARERELGERLGLSLEPVRQALVDLAKEGYLQRVQGRGTFVCRTKVEQKTAILSKDYPVEFSRVIYRADRFRFALESRLRTGRVVHVMSHPN